MFSYRHSFHAGNHADVLKHMVLVQVIKHLLHKDKPFWVIDTHAGSGLYDLGGKHASTSGEAVSGIAQLWPHRQDTQLPTAVRTLLEQVAHINHGDDLAWYPGSPQLAAQMLREGDHLRLFELRLTKKVFPTLSTHPSTSSLTFAAIRREAHVIRESKIAVKMKNK